MKIAIDLRSLQSGTISGVENYTQNLLENLLAMDKNNTYLLFFNGVKPVNSDNFKYINAKIIKKSVPNKLLNFAFKFNLLNLENLIGGFDVLFMPNLNVINLKTKTKIAITVHDMSPVVAPEFYDLKRRLWHKFLNIKKLLNRADIIFAVSNFTKNGILRLYNLPERKIQVVYPGIDTQIFNPEIGIDEMRDARNCYGLPGNYFLFLNTIEPRKNLNSLIRAFELANVKSHLVIAGKKGWKTFGNFQLLKKSSKADKIHYIGYVEEEKKPALIKMATAVVYPSLYEGFGFQALEAMSIKTPLITSQISSLPEVAGDSALLINPQNIHDLSAALNEMEKNTLLREMFVKKSFERTKKFEWKTTANQILAGLESLRI